MSAETDIRRATNDLVQQRLYEEALLYLEGVESDDGSLRPFVEFMRGHIYIAMRDFTRARMHYKLSFENEYRVESAEMIATLLMAEGRLDAAIEFLERTIASENENLRLLKFDLCKFYVISDRFQDADRTMASILPGLAPPLPESIASEAHMLRTAILAEFEGMESFPNIRVFMSLVDGSVIPAGKDASHLKGAEGRDESSP
jgi:tetratricopeptide (TPR) repeat protein